MQTEDTLYFKVYTVWAEILTRGAEQWRTAPTDGAVSLHTASVAVLLYCTIQSQSHLVIDP